MPTWYEIRTVPGATPTANPRYQVVRITETAMSVPFLMFCDAVGYAEALASGEAEEDAPKELDSPRTPPAP